MRETLPLDCPKAVADQIDLVQDLTNDCSVVASLCAGTARAERGHPSVHPFSACRKHNS